MKEIERKFLVDHEKIKKALESSSHWANVWQGYHPRRDGWIHRLRITDTLAFLTIKTDTKGVVRKEFETPMTLDQAQELRDSGYCFASVEKVRHHLWTSGKCWEIDVFGGANTGLILAEVELVSEDEEITIPDFVTSEVTDKTQFRNDYLALGTREWENYRPNQLWVTSTYKEGKIVQQEFEIVK